MSDEKKDNKKIEPWMRNILIFALAAFALCCVLAPIHAFTALTSKPDISISDQQALATIDGMKFVKHAEKDLCFGISRSAEMFIRKTPVDLANVVLVDCETVKDLLVQRPEQ